MSERHIRRFSVWLAAVAFLAIQTVAFAHEIKHDLHQHDASCALHVYAEQVGKLPAADVAFVAVILPDVVPIAEPITLTVAPSAPRYLSRAPPLSSLAI